MKNIFKPFWICLLLLIMSCYNKPSEVAVATESNGTITFTDTIALKQSVMFDLRGNFQKLFIDKTKIRQLTTFGERGEKIYALQLTDIKNQTRIVKYVFRIDKSFYLYESLAETQQRKYESNLFYQVYFACSGSDSKDCEPNAAVIENELKWGCGTKMICDPNSACKGSEILVVK